MWVQKQRQLYYQVDIFNPSCYLIARLSHCASVNDWICGWWRRSVPMLPVMLPLSRQYLDIYTVSTQYLHSGATSHHPCSRYLLPTPRQGWVFGGLPPSGEGIFILIRWNKFENDVKDVKLPMSVHMLTLSCPSWQYLPLRPMVGISWHPTKYCTGTAGCWPPPSQCGALQLTPHLNGFTKTYFIPNFTAQIVPFATNRSYQKCLLLHNMNQRQRELVKNTYKR